MELDVTFDFRSDSKGKDPDLASEVLKNYHRILWSKPLPSGDVFNLVSEDSSYLTYVGKTANHVVSSDSIVNSYSQHKRMKPILQNLDPILLAEFRNINSTIGGFIVFPANRINGKPTINGERGFNPLIADRFDLTLECIRRYFLNLESPMSQVLNRYSSFFSLFVDFKSYVEFFLLNDLVEDNFSKIKYLNYLGNLFEGSPLPKDERSYLEYRTNSMVFTTMRNKRIESWAKAGR